MSNIKDFFVIQGGTQSKISRHSSALWVEDSFMGNVHAGLDGSEENNFLGISLSNVRVFVLLICFCGGLFFLWSRSFYLQIIKAEHYSLVAEGNRVREYMIKPTRGIIFDANGRKMVENIPSFSLYLIPADLPADVYKRQKNFNRIYKIISKYGTSADEANIVADMENKVKDVLFSYQEVLVKENLSYDEALSLKIASVDLSGIKVETESRRNYLLTGMLGNKTLSFSHILGYLGRISSLEYEKNRDKKYSKNEYIGKNGIELSYEPLLRGVPGKKTVEVDARGKPKKVISRKEPFNGKNLTLSIDFELQSYIEQILSEQFLKFGTKRAAVVVENPQNGEIVALISLPSYDINKFARGITSGEYSDLLQNPNNPLFPRVISGEYPSGSTFKPIVAAAALEEGIINYNTLIHSVGGVHIKRWFFPDWKAGGHGYVNVTRAIAESVNTFFYLVGGGDQKKFTGLGVKRIKSYAEQFGLSKKTGIDIPGEKAGFIPDPEWKKKVKKERWYIGDTYHLAIGQGDILVTPLQIANATAVFANGGTLYQPHLVKEVSDQSGSKRKIYTKEKNKDFIGSDNMKVVRYGMRKAVLSGSARSLSLLPIKIAGKTGTAQWANNKKNHAWFTSFAPFDNAKIVVTVLIEEAGEGSDFAVPIAGDIYRWIYQNRKTLLK